MKTKSILSEAESVINGPRREAYGPAGESFRRIARVWSGLMSQKLKAPLSSSDVALMMTALKLCREVNKPGRDNRLDAIGYIALMDQIEN